MNIRMKTASSCIALATAFGAALLVVPAQAQDGLQVFLDNTKLLADFRYRYEHVDQNGFAKAASANTSRLRLGLQNSIGDFTFLVEGEGTMHIAGDYNDTINGKTGYPAIPDPENIELNRAQIAYGGIPGTQITIGRQRINIDTQRFIGAVGFRQNEQTFDAVRIVNKSVGGLELGYFYANRVNRVSGERSAAGHFDGDVHAINGSYNFPSIATLSAYVYLLDLKQAPSLSTATFGFQANGSQEFISGYKLIYVGEYAHQTEFAKNPAAVALNYWHAELGMSHGSWNLIGAVESLGGNGAVGFSTPLGTLHKFQGYADVFLTTPASGIVDFYPRLSYQSSIKPFDTDWPIMLAATYHDFSREKGSGWLGGETDLEMTAKISQRVTFGLKQAFFTGGGGFASRDKTWVSLDFVY
jgi:hypothetical protein